MENDQKIIELLKNEYVSNYAISKLSGEQMTPETPRRYRKVLDKNGLHLKYEVVDISKMKKKTKARLLKIAEEVERIQPKSKKDVQRLIREINCSGEFW